MSMLLIRPAEGDDCMDLLRWRNDALTRAMSRNSGMLEEQDHRSWFAKAIENPMRILLIGVCGNSKIGMVRFDRHEALSWEVNIVVAPEARGRALGGAMLRAALAHFFSLQPRARVLAEVLPNNIPSARLFRSVGFLPAGGGTPVSQYVLDRAQSGQNAP